MTRSETMKLLRSDMNATIEEVSRVVGRRTLTPPDPQLKGARCPGGFNPCAYQVKKLVSKFAFCRPIA